MKMKKKTIMEISWLLFGAILTLLTLIPNLIDPRIIIVVLIIGYFIYIGFL